MSYSRIVKTEKIEWKKASWFQNENLKHATKHDLDRLKTSLIKNGFVMPFHVWEDREGVIWILDGHHRQKALEEIQQEGVHEIPDELHATFIECENRKEAAELVLLYTAQYAKITQEGFNAFLDEHQLDVGTLDSFLNIDNWGLNFIFPDTNYEDANQEVDIDSFEDTITMKLKFSESDYVRVNQALAEIANTPEEAILQLIGNEDDA